MFYENQGMSTEEKKVYLELLLAQADIFSDAISMASIKSKEELVVVAEKAREIMKYVASEDQPPVLRKDPVPIIGETSGERAERHIESLDSFLLSQLEAQLEMNLAVVYTALIHGNGYTALVEPRGKLVGQAAGKTYSDNEFGKMVFFQRLGAMRLLDASAIMSGLYPEETEEDLAIHVKAGTEALIEARDSAHDYNPFNELMATFNLGRLEFIQGKNKDLAREYLQKAQSLSRDVGNALFQEFSQHYLSATEDGKLFGTVIDDPSEYKVSMMGLVTEVLRPEERLASGIVLP